MNAAARRQAVHRQRDDYNEDDDDYDDYHVYDHDDDDDYDDEEDCDGDHDDVGASVVADQAQAAPQPMPVAPAAVPGATVAAVTNTLNAIMHAMDAGDGDAFASYFTPDASCHVAISGVTARGPAEIAGLCRTIKSKFPTAQHWEGNVWVRVSTADQLASLRAATTLDVITECAVNTSYWQANDGGDVIARGEHRDVLVRRGVDGAWLVMRREIIHQWTKSSGFVAPSNCKPEQ